MLKVDLDCEQSVFCSNSVGKTVSSAAVFCVTSPKTTAADPMGKKATKNATQGCDRERTSVTCEAWRAQLRSHARFFFVLPRAFPSQRETAHNLTGRPFPTKNLVVFLSLQLSACNHHCLMSSKRWPRCEFIT